ELSRTYTRIANEDYSALGPVGIVALLAASIGTVWSCWRRTADMRHLALACALPSFLVIVSLSTFWNPFLIRFFLVPVALAAPLLARLFRSRSTAAPYFAVGALVGGLTLARDMTKPLVIPNGYRPSCGMTQEQALVTH